MQYVSHELVTPPAIEPVALADLKRQLRLKIDSDRENDYLGLLITAARDYLETATSRAFITQTWRVTLDAFPRLKRAEPWWDGVRQGAMTQNDAASPIILPRAPVRSAIIRTYLSVGDAVEVAEGTFRLDGYNGKVFLNPGKYWPSNLRLTGSAVEVDYVMGYGDAALDVPGGLRMAIMQLAAHWYENRVPVMQGSGVSTTEVPLMVSSVIDRYKVRRV